MRGERVTPKPPDDVRLTMTVDEARVLRRVITFYASGRFADKLIAAIDEALA